MFSGMAEPPKSKSASRALREDVFSILSRKTTFMLLIAVSLRLREADAC